MAGINTPLKLSVLLCLFSWALISLASEINDTECVQNLKEDLPIGIKKQLQKEDGIESYEQLELETLKPVDGKLFNPVELKNRKVQLIAAVILPTWFFCPSAPEYSRDAPRKLVFWKASGATWRKIGSNEQAFWPVIMAGQPKASLSIENDLLVYKQEANPTRAYWNDEFYFAYEQGSSRIVLVKWDSHNYYFSAQGDIRSSDELEQAEKKVGHVSAIDGYEGTFNFNLGLGEIIKHRFAERPVQLKLYGLAHGIYIENLPKGMSFDGFDKFKFSKP